MSDHRYGGPCPSCGDRCGENDGEPCVQCNEGEGVDLDRVTLQVCIGGTEWFLVWVPSDPSSVKAHMVQGGQADVTHLEDAVPVFAHFRDKILELVETDRPEMGAFSCT